MILRAHAVALLRQYVNCRRGPFLYSYLELCLMAFARRVVVELLILAVVDARLTAI
jgi:hypothetical protein